jgi:hypothetical protein
MAVEGTVRPEGAVAQMAVEGTVRPEGAPAAEPASDPAQAW